MNSAIFLLAFIYIIVAGCMKLARQVKEQAEKNAGTAKTAPQKQHKAPKAEAKAPAPAPESEEGSFFRPTVMQPTITVTEHDDSVYQGSMSADTAKDMIPATMSSLLPSPPPRPRNPSLKWLVPASS